MRSDQDLKKDFLDFSELTKYGLYDLFYLADKLKNNCQNYRQANYYIQGLEWVVDVSVNTQNDCPLGNIP